MSALLLVTTIFSSVSFIGYVVGRWADNYLNFWVGDLDWVPDHWIYGLALMVAAIVVFSGYLELYIFSFGVGHLISDLKDCLHVKCFGSDNKEKSKVKFWHID